MARAYWYIATTGNDTTGDGSSGNPWATLGKAVSEAGVAAGDIVTVAAGTYAEAVTDSKGLIWKANGVVTVTGNGTMTLTKTLTALSEWHGFTFTSGTGAADVVILNASAMNLRLYGCTVDAGKASGTTYGIRLYSSAASTGVVLKDCTLTNSTYALDYGVYVQGAQVRIENLTTDLAVDVAAIFCNNVAGAENNAVTILGGAHTWEPTANNGCWLENRSKGTLTVDGGTLTVTASLGTYTGTQLVKMTNTSAGQVQPVVIANMTITLGSNAFAGTAAAATKRSLFQISRGIRSITLVGNRIVNLCNQQALVWFDMYNAEYLLVARNVMSSVNTYDNVFLRFTGTIANTCRGCTVAGNVIQSDSPTDHVISIGTEATGTYDGMCDNVVRVVGNVIKAAVWRDDVPTTSLHVIFVGFNKGATVANNRVIGGSYGIVLKGDTIGGGHVTDYAGRGGAWGNVCINQRFNGILLKGATNVPVVGNTVYQDKDLLSDGAALRISRNTDPTASNGAATGARFVNNIVYVRSGNYAFSSENSANLVGLDFRANLFYDHSGGTGYLTENLTAWATGTAYVVGDVRVPTGHTRTIARCAVAGTSHAATEPTWPTTLGAQVTDGTVTWEIVAVAGNPQLLNKDAATPVVCIGKDGPAYATGVAMTLGADGAGRVVPQGIAPCLGAYEWVASDAGVQALPAL